MWQRMGYDNSDEFNWKWIRYIPYFRNMALAIKHIMGETYNAMHIRMGDYTKRRIDHQDVGSLFLDLSKSSNLRMHHKTFTSPQSRRATTGI